MTKHVFGVGFITMSLLLSGCTSITPQSNELSSIRDVKPTHDRVISITGLRYTAIRDAALSLGARGGLAWRSNEINRETEAQNRQLDRIFNFNAMLLDENILPPVLIEGRNTLEQTSEDNLRLSDRSFAVVSQARFVTAAPTWRDYLVKHYKKPEMPDRSLLPRDETELKVWERYVEEGWRAGVSQANTIFLENLGRLKRDYEGMVRYQTLLAQNMVTKPFVAKVDLGVTGGNNEMAINDRVLRITAKPGFQQKSDQWRTEITLD